MPQHFQSQIEEFIERHDLSPTTFGLWAMNDSRFVFDLQAGRRTFHETQEKVRTFMAAYEAKQAAKLARHQAQQ